MARTASSITTITDAKAASFLRNAEERESLFCKHIPGFHLMKLTRGASWRYRYTDPTGKRKVATVGKFANLKPAQAAEKALNWRNSGTDVLAEKKAQRAAAQNAAKAAEARTMRTYLDDYYRPFMERSWKPQNAAANYRRLSNRFSELLDRDMATIDKADIDRWQRQLEKKGRAFSTIRRDYGALKTMLNRAVRDKVLGMNPLANHKLLDPTIADQTRSLSDPAKADRRLLTDAEIKGILSGLDDFAEEARRQRRNSRKHGKPNLPDLDKVNYPHWFIPFCHLALHTGLAPSDLYTLTWEQLSVNFGRLTKIREKTSHAARREKKPAVLDMNLNPTITGIMKKWHTDQGKPEVGLVFPSPVTGGVMDSQAHRKPWAHVKTLGELPAGLNFYALRHHFISTLMAAGVPIFTVAKLAGHKGVEMIMSHYGHLSPNQATEALDIVARTITGTELRVTG